MCLLLPAALGSKAGSVYKPTARTPVEISQVNRTYRDPHSEAPPLSILPSMRPTHFAGNSRCRRRFCPQSKRFRRRSCLEISTEGRSFQVARVSVRQKSPSVAPRSAAGVIPDACIEVLVEAKMAMPPRKVATAETCAAAAEVPREEAGSSNLVFGIRMLCYNESHKQIYGTTSVLDTRDTGSREVFRKRAAPGSHGGTSANSPWFTTSRR